MDCTHRTPEKWEWKEVEVGWYGETEMQRVQVGELSTQEDLDIGRFQCTQCGEVGYYTGRWKKFFEEGVPCLGSDRLQRTT